MAWTRLVWLRIGTGGGMNLRASWLAEGLFSCCMGPVTCSCCGWCAWTASCDRWCHLLTVRPMQPHDVGSKFHHYPSGGVNWLVIPVPPSPMTVAVFSATFACPKSHHCVVRTLTPASSSVDYTPHSPVGEVAVPSRRSTGCSVGCRSGIRVLRTCRRRSISGELVL